MIFLTDGGIHAYNFFTMENQVDAVRRRLRAVKSIYEFARLSGLSHWTIRNVMNARNDHRIGTIDDIEAALDRHYPERGRKVRRG